MEAAERRGYVPDLLAASLRSERSNLVAVLVDGFSNPHKLAMKERLTRIAQKQGWDTRLVNMLDEADTSEALSRAGRRCVDAAILIGVQFNEEVLATALGAQRVKNLIIFARDCENPDTISICCDDVGAMSTIAGYVLGKGFRNPLFLAGPRTGFAHLQRKETFLDRWCQKRGNAAPSISVPFYGSYLAHERLTGHFGSLDRSDHSDFVAWENDAPAIGAINAIRFRFGLCAFPGAMIVPESEWLSCLLHRSTRRCRAEKGSRCECVCCSFLPVLGMDPESPWRRTHPPPGSAG